jgi:hypothetical protein
MSKGWIMVAALQLTQTLRRVTVEDFLTWVYQVERAHRAYGAGLQELEARADGVERQGRAATGVLCDRLRQVAALGVAIDSFGVGCGGRLHPDAEAAHEFITRLDGRVQAVLIRHAVAGERPDWHPGPAYQVEPLWLGEPAYDDRGWPKRGRYRAVTDEAGRTIGAAVRVTGPGQAFVDACRAEWLMWVTGIMRVAAHFQAHPGKLRAHLVTAGKVEVAPWGRK